jgi:hypothetical protein
LAVPAYSPELVRPEILSPAATWFLESGIQEPSGGVARYYLSDRGQNARISTEITGYALKAHLLIWRLTGDERMLSAAVSAGNFLLWDAWDPALRTFPFEWAADGKLPAHAAYFFDCGIIARGLIALWQETAERAYLDAAILCGESMMDDFVNAHDIDPILELPSKKPAARQAHWSRSSDCYQMKAALAWLELAEITAREDFEREYHKALRRALASESKFLDLPDREKVMDRLHAYSYYLESLLPMAHIPECRESLEAGIARAAQRLRDIRAEFERSDVCAQLLRVRLYADSLGAVRLNERAAEEEASWAASYQFSGPDPRIRGGFCFGRKNGAFLPYLNPVSTAFCVDALALWNARNDAGAEPPDWRDLI